MPTKPDWVTQIGNKPFCDTREYDFSRVSGSTASGNLAVSGAGKVIAVTNMPYGLGVGSKVYISGGTGTAEVTAITALSGSGGDASGTITVTTANAHTGAWALSSATGGWQEALIAAGANAVVDGSGTQSTIYATITVDSDNVTLLGSGCKITTSTFGGAMILLAGSGQTLDGLWIDQAHNDPAGDISVELGVNAKHIRVRNCKFTGSQTMSILSHVDGVRDVLIESNLFDQVRYGVIVSHADTVPSSGWDQEDFRIVHNRFDGHTADAVIFNFALIANGKTYYGGGKHFIVAHNSMSGGTSTSPGEGFGVSVAGAAHVNIEGNEIVNARWHGIHLEDKAADIRIVNNTINGTTGDGVSWSGDCAGVWATNSKNVTIQGNEIADTLNDGVMMNYDDTTVLQTSAYTIADNQIKRAGGHGIRLAGGRLAVLNAKVHGNYVDGSGKSAFYMADNPANIDVYDNNFLNSTRYGIEAEPSPGGFWGRNRLEGNTLGDMLRLGTTEPFLLQGVAVRSVGTVTAGVTPWQNVANMGQLASGPLVVTAWGFGTDYMTRSWNLVWDGTTLKDALGANPPAELGTDTVGTAITGIEIQMSGSILQARATAGFSGFDVYFSARFDGLISRR